MNNEQKAIEFLAAQWDRRGWHGNAAYIREGIRDTNARVAIAAITAALDSVELEIAGYQRRYCTEGMEWSPWSAWEYDDKETPFPETSGRWTNEYRPVFARVK